MAQLAQAGQAAAAARRNAFLMHYIYESLQAISYAIDMLAANCHACYMKLYSGIPV
jgi:hypothetical protein